MSLELKEINSRKIGFFRFRKLNEKYLLTNEIGEYYFLGPLEFDLFLTDRLEFVHPDLYLELQNKGFIREKLDFDGLSRRYASKNGFLFQGTSLHIVVVTLRCDHKCIYCQAGSSSIKTKDLDMDKVTAEKVVDRIFESPGRDITIEFQGGEPLINFDIIKFIVKYALGKNKKAKKNLMFTIVTNFTFMNKRILEFLIKNNIHICSSLDGSEAIHNKHRMTLGRKNSYRNTVKWIKILKKEYKSAKISYRPAALTTITRFSLSYSKEIINEYVNLGLEDIHLRPVTPFGSSLKIWQRINYTAEEFIDFYVQALNYIIDLNIEGKFFCERMAKIFLIKILTDNDPNFLDIRSPCGAGIGQLAYNFNGDVFTCDEGRMLGRAGDDSFRLGNVKDNCYKEMMNNPTVKTMCIASCLDNLPGCSHCAYKTYCGVCPLYNYSLNGNIFAKSTFLCKIYTGILDYLFTKLQEEKIKTIFCRWVGI